LKVSKHGKLNIAALFVKCFSDSTKNINTKNAAILNEEKLL